MKAVILAGGKGSRLAEETGARPKPMIEIGGRPMLWHIMSIYAHHGITDFVVCAGYRGYQIKEYFANLMLHHADVTIDLGQRRIDYHDTNQPLAWRVTVVDTGEDTMTGGRIKRVARYLDPAEPFCLTYGDGVGDVDITASIAFHRAHGRQATMTVVRPPARFGAIELQGDGITEFREKHGSDGGFINGGFFVVDPAVLGTIDGDDTVWERAPLERLAATGQLMAWRHTGFWQPMDTLREKRLLEELWATPSPPWKVWT